MRSAERGGFAVDDKGGATEYDFGLGLKMMMMANHHQSPNDESSASIDFSGDRDTPAAGGRSGGASGVRGGADFGAIFCSNSTDSWGARVFTPSQRQELERQTIIYKYMAASIPVPSDLLISMASRYPSNEHGSGCGKSAGRSKDQEPWRCKRTDGKKWRCAKDAVPDQRYCEKHSHKGRPSRSRKLVEPASTSSNSTRRISNKNTLISSPNSASAISFADVNIKPQFLYQSSPAMFMPQYHLMPSEYSNSRSPDWFFKREADHDQSIAGVPVASPFLGLHQMAPAANPPSTRASGSDFMGNEQTHSPLPRQFLDEGASDSSLLTLSTGGGGVDVCNEETEDASAAQLGTGLFNSERDGDIDAHLSERYAWMGPLAPGGPLAEALCLGIIGAGNAEGGADSYHGHGELGFMK